MIYRTSARVRGGWQNTVEFDKLEEWLKTIEGADFDLLQGASYINGRVFPAAVSFIREEDLLACKIIFSDLIY
jgi:hypothetical protein